LVLLILADIPYEPVVEYGGVGERQGPLPPLLYIYGYKVGRC